jgi:hypothetical protein
MGIWHLFGVGELSDRARAEIPLDAMGMQLLRRHRETAEGDPRSDPDWESRFRIGTAGRTIVVFLRTTWWREPRENSLGFLADTMRFVPTSAKGPGLLTSHVPGGGVGEAPRGTSRQETLAEGELAMTAAIDARKPTA